MTRRRGYIPSPLVVLLIFFFAIVYAKVRKAVEYVR